MGGNKKVNSDLDIKGKVKISTVPNKQGAVLIHDPITKEISTRTNLEFVNDLDLPTKDYVSQSISSNNQNYIPKSQINQPNGVAGLDANKVVPSDRIDDRLENKILMMTGEFYDSFISGFRDRNLLIDAYYNASQFDIDIVGNGSMGLGLEDTKKILTNSESNFIYFNNVDSSSQVVITIVYPTLFNNFSDGNSWQCIIESRLNKLNSFQNIKVETIGTKGVWNECYNVQNVQNIRGTGMYSFPVGEYNFSKNYPQFPFGIKGIRVTLSNPNSNIVYLSNIIFRHLSNTLAPQFPHIGQDNKFYETNEFKKPLIIPNGISSNHAITLAQLNGYVSISSLNTQLDNYVTKNGSVTINGTKTFSESPIVPTPTLSTHAVNKSYIDGNSSYKKELLWSRKLTIQPSSTNAYYPEPQGQVTNIDITGHGSIDAKVYLPQEAYNGQIINIVNYSAEKIKISGIVRGYFGVGQDTMVTMTFVVNTNNIDGVTYGTGRWVGMYMNVFNKLE